jgi:hypothetical protein
MLALDKSSASESAARHMLNALSAVVEKQLGAWGKGAGWGRGKGVQLTKGSDKQNTVI